MELKDLIKTTQRAERKTLYAELLQKALEERKFDVFDFIVKCEENDK